MKTLMLVAIFAFVLPGRAFADDGISASLLAKVLTSKSVTAVLKGRGIGSISSEKHTVMDSVGYLVSIEHSEVGLSPAGPSTHPCVISVKVLRPKNEPKAAYDVSASELCAMSAPKMR